MVAFIANVEGVVQEKFSVKKVSFGKGRFPAFWRAWPKKIPGPHLSSLHSPFSPHFKTVPRTLIIATSRVEIFHSQALA